MTTALTVYFTNTTGTTLSTSYKLSTTHGTDNVSVTQDYTLIGTATSWGEVYAQGNTGAWGAAGSIGSPSGHGFMLETSVLNLSSNTIVSGSWSANVRFGVGHTDGTLSGSLTGCAIHVRVYKYSSGTYTQIIDMALTGQTINATLTTYALSGSTSSGTSFTSGDLLYVDVWVQVGTNSNADSALNIRLNRLSTNSTGDSNAEVVTPGYAPQVIKDIAGRLKVDAQKDNDLSARLRVSAQTLRSLSSRFFLAVTRTQNVAGRLRASAQKNNDLQSRAFLRAQVSKDLSTRLFFVIGNIRDLASRLKLAAQKSSDLSLRARLQSTQTLSLPTRMTLLASRLGDSATRFLLKATATKDLATRLRFFVLRQGTTAARLLLDALKTSHVAGRFALQSIQMLSLVVRMRLLATKLSSLAARFALMAQSVKNCAARLRVQSASSSGSTVVTLYPPLGSSIGINYYHESMGYIGRTTAQITQDLQTIQLVTNKIKVYLNPLPQNSGGVSHSTALAKVQSIVSIAKSLGMYVVWVENIDQGKVLTDSTTNLSSSSSYKWKWADYSTQVVSDAAAAQAAGADEFLVGNEIRGSTHYYATDPGTLSATTIYTSTNFPSYVASLVSSVKSVFTGLVGYQEVNSVSAEWTTAGLGTLDKIYFDLYEKWTTFQSKASSLYAAFGSQVELGEVSSIDVLGTIGYYNAYTETDWSRELLRRYDYCRQLGITIWCFTYGDPSSTSHGFGLRLNTSDNQSFHDIWTYLLGTYQLRYTRQFLDTFPPDDFTGGTGGSSGELQVTSSSQLATVTSTTTDYVFRGQIRFFSSSGSVRLVTRYTDANNYYALNINIVGNSVTCVRRQGGTETTLGTAVPWPPHASYSGSLSSSTYTPFDFELRVSGTGSSTHLEMFFDTYKVVDVTDTSSTLSATICGLLYVNTNAGIGTALVSTIEQQINTAFARNENVPARFLLHPGTTFLKDIATRLQVQVGATHTQDIGARLALNAATPLSVYFAGVAASTITTADKLYTTSGASSTTATYSRVGLATGYGEITSQGTTSAWAASGSLGTPTGNGFLLDATTLEGKMLLGGAGWTATVRLNCAQNGSAAPQAGSLTADLFVRVYKYHSGTYTLITTMSLLSQALTFAFTNYTFTGSATIPDMAFETGAKLYLDLWANVTVNANASSVQDIRLNRLSTDGTLKGDSSAVIQTNGYVTANTKDLASRLKLAPGHVGDLSSRVKVSAQIAHNWLARLRLASQPVLKSLAARIRGSAIKSVDLSTRLGHALADDTFIRSNQSPWGVASDGRNTWSTLTGAETPSIVSNQGQITGATGDIVLVLGSSTLAGAEALVKTSLSDTAASSAILLRVTGSTTYYQALITSGGLSIQQVVVGSSTTLQTESMTIATSTNYWIKFRLSGIMMQAKCWQEGTSEPSGFQIAAESSAVSGSGQFGLFAHLTNASQVVLFDHFAVYEPEVLPTPTEDIPSRLKLQSPPQLKDVLARFFQLKGWQQDTPARLVFYGLAIRNVAARLFYVVLRTSDIHTRTYLVGQAQRDLTCRFFIYDFPPPLPPSGVVEAYHGLPSCLPIPIPSKSYRFQGATLDTPLICSAPPLFAGQLIQGSTFTLIFDHPTLATQALLANGLMGDMRLTLADGSRITATVKVSSVVANDLLEATFTVQATVSLSLYVVITQFF